jgi:STE24 endopeptidase
MHAITSIFLLAVALSLAIHLWLLHRQARHMQHQAQSVPAEFRGFVTAEEHARACHYSAARAPVAIAETVADALILLVLTLGGGIAAVGAIAHGLFDGSAVAAGTVHVLGTLALVALASLPFTVFRTFVLEERFGFNRTTWSTFVADLLKSAVLGAVLGGALVALLLWIMGWAGDRWWLLAWLAWLVFSLLLSWAWPRWLAPLFNQFKPLEDAPLRERIEALLVRCGFQSSGVFVMDGSRRSAHGNAYFTGLGRQKRIVFFDTLLSSLDPGQVESVLAHELGHFRLRHIPQRLVLSAALALAGFALLGWLARQSWFYAGLGVPEASNAAALLLFVFVIPVFTFLGGPLLAAWSRRHEYEADEFAAAHANGRDLADALVRLYRDNATVLEPDPWYSRFFDSHPAPVDRIRRLRARLASVPDPLALPGA